MRKVPGFPGYMVTSVGDLWSFREALPKRILPNWFKGYLHVNVKTAPGRSNMRKVPLHQIVLLAWVGPRPSQSHVGRHRDRNTSSNAAGNLLWGTPLDNIHDAIGHGTHVSKRRGEKHPRAKLSDADVMAIKSLAARGELQVSAFAASHGIDASTVRAIARNDPRYR